MRHLAAIIKGKFIEVLPPTIFFFVMFQIIANAIALISHGTGVSLPEFFAIVLAALILGKSVLFANMLPFINRFPDRPLIWNAGWKTAIYTVVALILRFLGHLYDYWKEAPSLVAANHQLLAEINWSHFWAVQILLVTLIANYCVMAELARLIGRRKLVRMFFGPMPVKPAGQAEA